MGLHPQPTSIQCAESSKNFLYTNAKRSGKFNMPLEIGDAVLLVRDKRSARLVADLIQVF